MESTFYVLYWWMELLYVVITDNSVPGRVAIFNEAEADERIEALLENVDVIYAGKIPTPSMSKQSEVNHGNKE